MVVQVVPNNYSTNLFNLVQQLRAEVVQVQSGELKLMLFKPPLPRLPGKVVEVHAEQLLKTSSTGTVEL